MIDRKIKGVKVLTQDLVLFFIIFIILVLGLFINGCKSQMRSFEEAEKYRIKCWNGGRVIYDGTTIDPESSGVNYIVFQDKNSGREVMVTNGCVIESLP